MISLSDKDGLLFLPKAVFMKKHEHYDVGLYLRLSKDDDVRSGDSSSITSQRTMLEKYVRDNGWTVHDFYIDDGYTGTNFSRPEFQAKRKSLTASRTSK